MMTIDAQVANLVEGRKPPTDISDLAHQGMVYYLATPYSNAPGGHEHAYRIACITAARLIDRGVNVFSPIAHGHAIAQHGQMKTDAIGWAGINNSILAGCDGLIVAMAPGWRDSSGVAEEIELAEWHDLPVYYMSPDGVISTTPPSFDLGEAA